MKPDPRQIDMFPTVEASKEAAPKGYGKPIEFDEPALPTEIKPDWSRAVVSALPAMLWSLFVFSLKFALGAAKLAASLFVICLALLMLAANASEVQEK